MAASQGFPLAAVDGACLPGEGGRTLGMPDTPLQDSQPKSPRFEIAPEESRRRAQAQIKAEREQIQQSSNGRSYADEGPHGEQHLESPNPPSQNVPPKSERFERAPEESIRRARAQIKAVREQTQQPSSRQSYADSEPQGESPDQPSQNLLPKWGPFERAPEHMIRKARAQVEAGRRQCEEMSRGRSYEDGAPPRIFPPKSANTPALLPHGLTVGGLRGGDHAAVSCATRV